MVVKRERFSTTLKEDTLEKLEEIKKIMKVRYINDVIENMVDEKWEELKNGMEKENRDI
jgi:hypothetical protein